jgi:hypothetical protein
VLSFAFIVVVVSSVAFLVVDVVDTDNPKTA